MVAVRRADGQYERVAKSIIFGLGGQGRTFKPARLQPRDRYGSFYQGSKLDLNKW